MLEEGIRERIVRAIFECTEHHQTIGTFRSRRTFFRHTVLDTLRSGVRRDGIRHGGVRRDVIHPD